MVDSVLDVFARDLDLEPNAVVGELLDLGLHPPIMPVWIGLAGSASSSAVAPRASRTSVTATGDQRFGPMNSSKRATDAFR
jgi:hypothetical protein